MIFFFLLFNSVDVHGGWSNYTEWSSCLQTCGYAIQSRSRTCNNPAPQGNGRQCVGSDIESRSCNNTECQGRIYTLYLEIVNAPDLSN